MFDLFYGFRELTVLSVALRMFLAVACGGVIGIERTVNRHTAGFRTHILVCLGAALTTLTGQYLYLYMGYFTDMARLGAQVIAGIGFLGAGTIITSRERVRGLTTAAGLWTSAIIGLAIGAGFYEGAILATILVEIVATIFLRLENHVVAKTSNVHVFLEYRTSNIIDHVLEYCHVNNIDIMNIEIARPDEKNKMIVAIISMCLKKGQQAEEIIGELDAIEGVMLTERVE